MKKKRKVEEEENDGFFDFMVLIHVYRKYVRKSVTYM